MKATTRKLHTDAAMLAMVEVNALAFTDAFLRESLRVAAERIQTVAWIDRPTWQAIHDIYAREIAYRERRDGGRCESGWTGDRCTFPLFHDGPHSN